MSKKKQAEELEYVPEEVEAQVKLGPRDFRYVRKISLSNYNPTKKFETEDYGVTHDSFKQARELVEEVITDRITELRGVRHHTTKE